MTDRPTFQLTQPKPPESGRDPFVIDGPTCLSFSGGSTSGYMLWRTLRRKRLKFQLLIACSLGCGGSWCETGLRNGPRRSTPPRM